MASAHRCFLHLVPGIWHLRPSTLVVHWKWADQRSGQERDPGVEMGRAVPRTSHAVGTMARAAKGHPMTVPTDAAAMMWTTKLGEGKKRERRILPPPNIPSLYRPLYGPPRADPSTIVQRYCSARVWGLACSGRADIRHSAGADP